ncbi:MAG: hypothetical protein F6K65_33725 [Moorea sp. SIO3C2]|nr:hypothetical protein [Moorena sp. SIO3C2]
MGVVISYISTEYVTASILLVRIINIGLRQPPSLFPVIGASSAGLGLVKLSSHIHCGTDIKPRDILLIVELASSRVILKVELASSRVILKVELASSQSFYKSN